MLKQRFTIGVAGRRTLLVCSGVLPPKGRWKAIQLRGSVYIAKNGVIDKA